MDWIMDLHLHTVASRHAYSTVGEYGRKARERGLEIIGISDHGYGMKDTTVKDYWKNIRIWPDYLEGVRLLKGAEINIRNAGGEIWEPDIPEKTDYCIFSLHRHCYEDDPGDKQGVTAAYIHTIQRYPHAIIGHADDGYFSVDYGQLVAACREYGAAVEINNASFQPATYRQNCRQNMETILSCCEKEEVPVLCGTDSHMAWQLGDFEASQELLNQLSFPSSLVINQSWEALEAFLGREL